MIDDKMYMKQCCVCGCELLWDMGKKPKVFPARNWTRTCQEERAVRAGWVPKQLSSNRQESSDAASNESRLNDAIHLEPVSGRGGWV